MEQQCRGKNEDDELKSNLFRAPSQIIFTSVVTQALVNAEIKKTYKRIRLAEKLRQNMPKEKEKC